MVTTAAERRGREELTQRYVDRLAERARRGPPAREEWHMDAKVRGFGVRVRTNGKAYYYLRTQDRYSKLLRKLLGPVENMTLGMARELASTTLIELRSSTPDDRQRWKEMQTRTFGDAAEEWLEVLEAKGRSQSYLRDVRQQLRDYLLPALDDKPLLDIKPRQLDLLLSKLGREKPYAANRVRSSLVGIFSLCRREGYIVASPVEGLARQDEQPRRRVLDDEEMARLLGVLEEMRTDPKAWASTRLSAAALMLVPLTTTRPGELLKARWEEFDLERGIWVKPAAQTKTRREHTVGLSSEALSILRDIPREGPFVFHSARAKSGHLEDLKAPWKEVCGRAGIKGATIYDLRRTSATRMLARGADVATVMLAGNWASPHVLLKHYAQPLLETQRKAAEGLFKGEPRRT